jgi:hypothetical protein
LALEASYGRSSLNALSFLKKTLRMCTNKPLVIVDRGPWYRWAFERLGLEYRHERFGMRDRVERFFRHLKERTVVFHHKMSARNHIQGINNLKLFLNLFTLYYQAARGREQKCLFGHYLLRGTDKLVLPLPPALIMLCIAAIAVTNSSRHFNVFAFILL